MKLSIQLHLSDLSFKIRLFIYVFGIRFVAIGP